MSNFKLGYSTIQLIATATANLTASTTRALTNLFSGSRSERFELATASTDILIVNYDLGASVTKTANFLAVMRAKLLHRNDCTGIRLRGSTQSATLPSTLTPTAWFDPNRGVTTSSGAVSQWNDLSGNNYHATQGTAASRPLLSRSDTSENQLLYSDDAGNAAWTSLALTSATSAATTDALGNNTATRLLCSNTTSRHVRYQSGYATRPAGTQYTFSVDVKKDNYQYLWIGDQAFSSWHGAGFNLNTGAFTGSETSLISKSVESLGNGWYRVTVSYTASSSGNPTPSVYFDPTGAAQPNSFLAAGTEAVYIARASFRSYSAGSTHLTTTSIRQFAGINGNKALVFDGTNDSEATTLAVNPTSGMWGACYIKVNSTAAVQRILTAQSTASERFALYIDTSGRVNCYVSNGAANSIARRSANGDIVAGTGCVLTFTYDGSTSATGIKIYKNGVQIDTTTITVGAYTVPVAGDVLTIGGPDSSQYFNGYLSEIIYKQGGTLSGANQTIVEAYLTTKYITTPIFTIDTLSATTLMGPNDEDYFTVFTESAAFRHWWLEFVNTGTASNYACSSVFFGKALDFGRDPQLPISIDQSRQAPWSREAALSTTINLGPISDTNKETFLNEVVKNSDVLPIVALDPAAYVFNDSKGMHCKITDHNVEPYFGADNDISITLEEEI